MRYTPERSLFEDFFNTGMNTNGLMRTDIRKKDGNYALDIELPGYKKEDIQISLFNGSLTVKATRNETSEEKNEKGEVLRSERSYGSVSRTFYVGDTIKDTDVHAAYDNGILTITVPTAEKKEAETKKFIGIE